MTDALTEARAMDLPAAAVARVARHAHIGLDDAEVAVAWLVQDLRKAGWTVERHDDDVHGLHGFNLNIQEHGPVDPRVARALQSLATAIALHLAMPEVDLEADWLMHRSRILALAQGTIE